MKKMRRLFINLIAILMIALSCFSLSACSKTDIRTIKVTIEVNTTDSTTEYTIPVSLYRHLAPKTVDQILDLVNKKFYDGVSFYKLSSYSNQIMFGEYMINLKSEEGKVIVKNTIDGNRPATIEGEFSKNSTTGSDLTNVKGTLGLWRTWNANDSSYSTSATGFNTGRGTVYMPTSSISSYDTYFSVFGKIDLDNTDYSKAFTAITTALSTTESYTIYYTKTGDAEPVMHYVLTENYKENEITDLYTPAGTEGTDYVWAEYKAHAILVPVVNKESKDNIKLGAYIKTVTVA